MVTDKTEIKPAHANVYQALAAAQMEFGAVTKGATNPAFKTKYANLSDVASVVIPTMARHGVATLHYLTGDGLSAMRTEFVHGASDTRVSCDVPLIVDRNNMQGMKSATTYAKRIGLESLSGVAPEDDDGNDAKTAAPPQAQRHLPKDERPAQPPPDPTRHAPRDPVQIANGIIAEIAKRRTIEDLTALFMDETKASKAWDWLALEHPAHSQRVADAKAERETALAITPY